MKKFIMILAGFAMLGAAVVGWLNKTDFDAVIAQLTTLKAEVVAVNNDLNEAEAKREDSQTKETQAKDTRNQAAAAVAESEQKLKVVQRALGVTADGDFGRADSETRRGIAAFQSAMSLRDGTWPADEGGTLCGTRTRTWLTTLGPRPAEFKTSFERFRLGNKAAITVAGITVPAFAVSDAAEMNELRGRLGLGEETDRARLWDGVRPKLDEKRRANALTGDVLDVPIYTKIY